MTCVYCGRIHLDPCEDDGMVDLEAEEIAADLRFRESVED